MLLVWTDEFEEAFAGDESQDHFSILEKWKKLYSFCSELLQNLLNMNDLSGVEKKRNCFYISLVIAKKDLIDGFLNTCLSSVKDFNWSKSENVPLYYGGSNSTFQFSSNLIWVGQISWILW